MLFDFCGFIAALINIKEIACRFLFFFINNICGFIKKKYRVSCSGSFILKTNLKLRPPPFYILLEVKFEVKIVFATSF